MSPAAAVLPVVLRFLFWAALAAVPTLGYRLTIRLAAAAAGVGTDTMSVVDQCAAIAVNAPAMAAAAIILRDGLQGSPVAALAVLVTLAWLQWPQMGGSFARNPQDYLLSGYLGHPVLIAMSQISGLLAGAWVPRQRLTPWRLALIAAVLVFSMAAVGLLVYVTDAVTTSREWAGPASAGSR